MTVFENEEDRSIWLTKLGEVVERFAWRVHAYVLMDDHFHLLLETPKPNLVAGMKWFMGVYSQGWNRRRQRRGHVFQGRYKAVVVDAESPKDYLRMVADYMHLNPVRSGQVGGHTGRRLDSWSTSSFPAYAGRSGPDWLVVDSVLGDLSPDKYGAELEERAKNRQAVLSEASLKRLRRGWYLGEREFGQQLAREIAAVSEREHRAISGEVAKAHDVDQAERLMQWGLEQLGLPTDPPQLEGWGKWVAEKSLLSALVRRRTGVSNVWVAERLAMGHEGNVTRALRRVRESQPLSEQLQALEDQVPEFSWEPVPTRRPEPRRIVEPAAVASIDDEFPL